MERPLHDLLNTSETGLEPFRFGDTDRIRQPERRDLDAEAKLTEAARKLHQALQKIRAEARKAKMPRAS